MIRLLAIPVLLAALAASAVVWSGAASSGADRADFAFVNRGDNKSLDPNTMSWMQDIRLAYALWEGLCALDPVTLKPILGIADRAEVDPQTHTIWTFHIRPTAKWSNGDPVKAGDFIFCWRRFLETPGEYSYLHFYIRGAKQYSDAFADYVAARQKGDTKVQPPDFHSVGEEAPDDQTIRVTLVDPIPFFPALCAFPCFFPMHEPSMRPFASTDPITGVTTYKERFTRPPNLITDGPYRMAEWSFKRRVRLVASDYYWDRANVKSKVIDQVYFGDALSAFRAYERGDVDWIAEADADLCAAMLQRGGRSDMHIFPAFGTYFYSFNCLPKLPGNRPNPLADIRVRQALCMSIDKDIVSKQGGRLGQPVARDYIPPGVFQGYDSPPGLPFDIAAAKKLLADAGYPNGQGFPPLTILYNTESVHGDIAQIIRNQWAANLGINIDTEGVEVKVFGARLHSQDYDIARASWYGDYDDPTTFTDKYKPDSDDNDSKWINAEYAQLCADAQKQVDVQKRLQLLSKAENILLNEAPIMPLYTYVNAYLFHDNVKGIPLSSNAMIMFKSVEVEK